MIIFDPTTINKFLIGADVSVMQKIDHLPSLTKLPYTANGPKIKTFREKLMPFCVWEWNFIGSLL